VDILLKIHKEIDHLKIINLKDFYNKNMETNLKLFLQNFQIYVVVLIYKRDLKVLGEESFLFLKSSR
jgi:hypothetical protein